MNKKIYLIQPTYRDQTGRLLKGKKLYIVSLALPALSAIIPKDWEKEVCYEYFDEINFETTASVIGISSMGYEIFRGIEIAEEFKKRGKKVIFGGFQSHVSKDYLNNRCDSIIHGNPGKPAMERVLKDIENNKLKKEYFCNVDLNFKLDYPVLNTSKIFFAPVLFSMGCRNNCDYCIVGSIYKGHYHLRNVKYVMEELDYLHRFTKKIAVVDTNFYNNRQYLIKICNYMISKNYKFVWGGQSTIDIGDDKEILTLLKKAGCKVLFIGLETIEQANLDAVHKDYSVDSYKQKIENIQKAGIKIAGFFMYGLDGDTKDTSEQMANYIINNKIALPMLNVLVPTPGTRIYEKLKKEGRILMNDEQDFLKNNPTYNASFNLCFYKPKNLTTKEVEEGFLDVLRRLSGIYQVIRRSLSKSITLTLLLLYMNWAFRREYFLLKKRRQSAVKTKKLKFYFSRFSLRTKPRLSKGTI
jgi:radical SAM superfamily enzyme YgiQ (UPF0313 family)